MAISHRKKRFGLTEIFSDFDISMSAQSQDLKKMRDVNAIMNSVRNIIYTRKGERPMSNIGFGAALDRWLFEPVDNDSLLKIGEILIKAIEDFEPRVEVINLEFEPITVTADNNTLSGTLTIRVINYDARQTFSLDFYLNI
jgi:phage baseplate assembly protein W